jgi:phosphoglycerol geranylgeranyltransferase
MKILNQIASKQGQIALLIDPEKTKNTQLLDHLLEKATYAQIDYIFVGGSTVHRSDIETVVGYLKEHTTIPIILFPGASHQLSEKADALLFLNLISGRNPDFLIGHHVQCAEEVFEMDFEVLPTSYLLIDGGKTSSVAYVSQTNPIPNDQTGIALNTALAGHLLGHRLTYLDAGSGALQSVPVNMIRAIRQKLSSPIIVGGGIRSVESVEALKDAGANIIVIGNKIEENIDFLLDIAEYQQKGH